MLHRRKANTFSRRVGLDIGSHTIKAVEVFERGPDIVVRSADCVSLRGARFAESRTPEPSQPSAIDRGEVVQAIKALWMSAGFQSKQVVLALPPDAVYVKWLHLEAADRETLDMTARAAATRGAPFGANDAIVDYRVLSSRGTSARNVHFVMLVAAAASAVDYLLDIAAAAGLEPLAVDIGANAALRCLGTAKRTSGILWSGQPVAHCIIGASSTTITVIRAGEPEFARTVPVGGNDFTECVADYCKLSWEDAERVKTTPGNRLVQGGTLVASINHEEVRVPCENVAGRLAREIQRSIRFFRSQFAEGSYLGMIGAMTISGGGALMKGIDSCLEEQGIDVAGVSNPFAGLSVAADAGLQRIGDTSAQYSTAVGLALGDYWSSATSLAAEAEMAA